ncbi:flavoprotein [Micromonospora sp. U21]|uniref:flavoprotein n=1 Tax=Micromonospora sp. U21 TaxID=2824899 RepID=UPI001B361F75|nr:flavoprotein [Micromonospora sp. U21]MBQ0906021.1 hypothetical protein [Micromonospora sp. U21]
MPGKLRSPVLHLVVCHAERAVELGPFITACQELRSGVHLIATPDAVDSIDRDGLADLTHHPVREDDQPETLHPLPPADAFAVVPASFDLVNKWAYGLNDNLGLRLLNEAIAVGLPVVAVPAPDPALARLPGEPGAAAALGRDGDLARRALRGRRPGSVARRRTGDLRLDAVRPGPRTAHRRATAHRRQLGAAVRLAPHHAALNG